MQSNHASPVSNPSTQFAFTIPAPQLAAARGRPGRPRNAALWLIGIGLCANALAMLYSRAFGQMPDIQLDRAALAQVAQPTGQLLGARGIYMTPAQLGPQTFGMYLMDVDSGTICVYRINPETSKIKLMAARSYKYDRFLEDLNNDPLTPKNVQKLVEDQRKMLDLHQKDDVPTVDQAAKPDQNAPDLPAPTIPR